MDHFLGGGENDKCFKPPPCCPPTVTFHQQIIKQPPKDQTKNVLGIEHESNVLKETSNMLIRNALMTSPSQNIDPYILFSCDTVPLSSVKVLLEGQLYIDASHRQKKINRASGKKETTRKK